MAERGFSGQAQHLLNRDAGVLVKILKLGRERPGRAVLNRFGYGPCACAFAPSSTFFLCCFATWLPGTCN